MFRSRLDGTSRDMFINGTRPLALTIDFVSRKLYWIDGNSVGEATLDGSIRRTIFSDDFFSPFQVKIVRNYAVVTSKTNTTYVLIRLNDLSATFIGTVGPTLYYGVSVISPLRKPSIGTSKY